MFSGDNVQQNNRVGSWVLSVDSWFELCGVEEDRRLAYAFALLTSDGSAITWARQEEDALQNGGKHMTWVYLAHRMVAHYAPPVALAALEAEWWALRMGVRSDVVGQSTRTVKEYTDRFVYLMNSVDAKLSRNTDHSFIRQRYVQGIKDGYPALYAAMLGGRPVLHLGTLSEAIELATVVEADLGIARRERERASTAQPSAPSWNPRSYRGGSRPPTALNALEGGGGYEADTADDAAEQQRWSAPQAQLYGIRYNPDSPANQDGRYRLSERDLQMLYAERRCFRCHRVHPVGRGTPKCSNLPAKSAPKPLSRSTN